MSSPSRTGPIRFARHLAVAALLVRTVPLLGQTAARFTLGLSAEALSDRHTGGGGEWSSDSLGGTASLGVDGSIVDRRFLGFSGVVQYSTFRLSGEGASSQTLRQSQWTYGGSFRAFSNRMVSVGGHLVHATSSTTGSTLGSVVGGVQDNKGANVVFRTKALPELGYEYQEGRFTGDDPAALRDESLRRHTFKALASYGRFLLSLEARKEDLEFFSGGIREDLRNGSLNVDVNRGGKNSWETVLTGNQLRVSFDRAAFTDPVTVYVARNTFRHKFTDETFVSLSYSRQQADGPGWKVGADSGSATVFRRLSEAVLLDAEASYLAQDGRTGSEGRTRQPSGSLGVQWRRISSGWNLQVYPRATYSAVSVPGGEAQSRLGGQLLFSAQKAWRRGTSLLIDLDGAYNRLTITSADAAASPADARFLAGLEKSRLRGRVTWNVSTGRRSRASLTGDATFRVRETAGRDLGESTYLGDVSVQWRSVSFGVSGSWSRQPDAAAPSESKVLTARASWYPLRWLEVDANAVSEDNEVLGRSGTYEYAEGGVRLHAAKLAFYARVRESISGSDRTDDRRDRRIWAGISRTFELPTLGWGGHRNGNGIGSRRERR